MNDGRCYAVATVDMETRTRPFGKDVGEYEGMVV